MSKTYAQYLPLKWMRSFPVYHAWRIYIFICCILYVCVQEVRNTSHHRHHTYATYQRLIPPIYQPGRKLFLQCWNFKLSERVSQSVIILLLLQWSIGCAMIAIPPILSEGRFWIRNFLLARSGNRYGQLWHYRHFTHTVQYLAPSYHSKRLLSSFASAFVVNRSLEHDPTYFNQMVVASH